MYIEYGNIFSITVSATVGVTLLCLSTTSTDNRSIEMKKKINQLLTRFKTAVSSNKNNNNNNNINNNNSHQDEAFLKALKSNGEIVNGIEMVKAIEAGNVTYVKNWLSKKTTQINQQFSDGSTVLHRAAALHGSTAIVKVLLERGVDIRAVDNECNTALHLAALTGNAMVVKLLCDRGMEPLIQNNVGETPIDLAEKCGNRGCVVLMKRAVKLYENNTDTPVKLRRTSNAV